MNGKSVQVSLFRGECRVLVAGQALRIKAEMGEMHHLLQQMAGV